MVSLILIVLCTSATVLQAGLAPVLHTAPPIAQTSSSHSVLTAAAQSSTHLPVTALGPEVECKICYTAYNQADCYRVLLDCSVEHNVHALCMDCLENITSVNRNYGQNCPVCRTKISFSKTVQETSEGLIAIEGQPLTADNTAKMQRIMRHLGPDQRPLIPVGPFPPTPVVTGRPKSGPTIFRNYISEAGVGFLLGLLMSSELKKTDDDDTNQKALLRTLYFPAWLCGISVLDRYKPGRRWDRSNTGCFALGLCTGMLMPHLSKKLIKNNNPV